MKAIVCEMCSSRDFAKQDGFYICQKCGMKYSSEEARKLMVDVPEDEAAPVDSGSAAQSEGSAELSNFLTIARRAKDEGNSERAEKYYDLVLQLDPNNWEANFYSVYYSSAQTNIAGITDAANKVTNVLPGTFELLAKSVPAEEQLDTCADIADKVTSLATSMYQAAAKHYFDIDTEIRHKYTDESRDRILASANMCYAFGELVQKHMPNTDDFVKLKNSVWKFGVEINKKAATKKTLLNGVLLDADGGYDMTSLAYEKRIAGTDKEYYKEKVLAPKIAGQKGKILELIKSKNKEINKANMKSAVKTGRVTLLFVLAGIAILLAIGSIGVAISNGFDAVSIVFTVIFIALGVYLFIRALHKNKQNKETPAATSSIDMKIEEAKEELAKLQDEYNSI